MSNAVEMGIFVGGAVLVVAFVVLGLGVISLPFAVLGWAVVTVVGMFTTVSATYVTSLAAGIVTLLFLRVIIAVSKS
jgi:hypothetical protein